MDATAKSHFTGHEEHSVAPTRAGVFWRPRAKTGFVSWLTKSDHKKIGFMYGMVALVCLIIGGMEALLIRMQLPSPENTFVTARE